MESTCPINAALVVLGDRWALLVVRDLLFAGYRTFNEFLRSAHGIATNILADRINGLLEAGIVTRQPDPDDGRKWIYSLTPKGTDLAPVLLELSKWGSTYENGVAPSGVLERWEADRAGFLAELCKRAGTNEATLAIDARSTPSRPKQPSAQRRTTKQSKVREKRASAARRK